jgi:phosphate-selective porin OprO/OprP
MTDLKSSYLFVFLFLVFVINCAAQDSKPAIKMAAGKGIQFTSADSTFTMAIGGRIQSLFEYKQEIADKTTGADFLLRRCRLNFQGTAFNPKFSYRIQLGFAHGDLTSGNSTEQNNLILRDAMLFYDAKKWLRIGFGQTKLPGNRQRQVSSANLQLVERSIANNNFTLDRDKGVWFYTNFKINKSVLKPTLAISSGEGRVLSNNNGKLCYSGRLEFLPFGKFSKKGELIEADIDREKKPKLSIAGAYSFNESATRTMGQLGEYLFNDETANINYYGTDVLFKYKGFSFESELYTRSSNKAVLINTTDNTKFNFITSGTTFMVQSGYFISKKNEIAARYAQINPTAKVSSAMRAQKEYVLGFSSYFNRHSLKLQNDLSYFENFNNTAKDRIIYRLSGVVTF